MRCLMILDQTTWSFDQTKLLNEVLTHDHGEQYNQWNAAQNYHRGPGSMIDK